MAADHLGEGEKEEEEGGIGHRGHAPKEQKMDTAVRDCPKISQLKCSHYMYNQCNQEGEFENSTNQCHSHNNSPPPKRKVGVPPLC